DPGARRAGVREGGAAAVERVDMDDVDDAAGAAGGHVRPDATAHVPGAVEVQIDDGPPSTVADVTGPAGELPAGVVDQAVDRPEALERLLYQGVDLFRFADVRRHRQAWRPEGRDLRCRRLEVLRFAAGNDDIRAEAGERQRDGFADAAAAAGDQR